MAKTYSIWSRLVIEEYDSETREHRDVWLDEETGKAEPSDNSDEQKVGTFSTIEEAQAELNNLSDHINSISNGLIIGE